MGYFRKAVRGKWFPSSETGQRLGVRNTVTDTISTWCNELQSLTKAHVVVTLPSRGLRSTHKCQTRPVQSQSNTQIPQYVFVSFIHSYISVLIPFGSSPITLSLVQAVQKAPIRQQDQCSSSLHLPPPSWPSFPSSWSSSAPSRKEEFPWPRLRFVCLEIRHRTWHLCDQRHQLGFFVFVRLHLPSGKLRRGSYEWGPGGF